MKRSLAVSAATIAMAISAVTTALIGSPAARADTAATPTSPPVLANSHGLTQLPTAPKTAVPNTAHDFVITVSTTEVAGTALNDGGHHIRIVLPAGYYDNPTRHYPVLYLLHGSSPDADPATYFRAADYPTVGGSTGMILVMPDGGPRGWYSNWLNQNSPAGAQRWENFHINQVIPFIDANLRTTPDKQHRAIAGISMGGFGAVRYAQRHPDVFSQVASFSGDLDLSRNSADLRLAVVASLTTYSPPVGSDDLYGTPYPFSVNHPYSDVLWNDASPGAHAGALQGIGVSVYVGNGGGAAPPVPGVNDPDGLALEWWLPGAANHFKAALDAAGVPSYFVNYGDGTGTPWADCRGGHNARCWNQDLADHLPRLQQAFGIQGA